LPAARRSSSSSIGPLAPARHNHRARERRGERQFVSVIVHALAPLSRSRPRAPSAAAQRPSPQNPPPHPHPQQPPGSTVLVAGATGGVGQLVTAKLLDRGYRVVALTRSADKARRLLGGGSANENNKLVLAEADARDRDSLARAFAEHGPVDAVVCTTGTTAFPSVRWEGNNGPRPTDLDGNLNLLNAVPRSGGQQLKRFVLVTSAGVERQQEFPWAVLNLWGVLTFKRASEIALEESGLPWTILRPSRLTDGPYTSFDLNTLLKATSEAQGLRGVELRRGDCLKGQASRVAVAEACVQALQSEAAEGRAFAIESVAAGVGPGADGEAWRAMFERA
jgi:uncharacterized protein YbjT (DUF2867 family)